jgi:hypothetical protein
MNCDRDDMDAPRIELKIYVFTFSIYPLIERFCCRGVRAGTSTSMRSTSARTFSAT